MADGKHFQASNAQKIAFAQPRIPLGELRRSPTPLVGWEVEYPPHIPPGFICSSVLRFSFIFFIFFCFSYSYVRQTKLASSLVKLLGALQDSLTD